MTNIQDSAQDLTYGPQAQKGDSIEDTPHERGKRYGKFRDHAEVAQTLKNVVANNLAARDRILACDQQEALDMICHKIARILNGDPDYADSWHDIAGYATLVENRLNGKSP